MSYRSLLAASAALFLVGAAGAQTIPSFLLSHGNAQYGEENLKGAPGRPEGGFSTFTTLPGGPENMSQNWWWYRTSLQGAERSLGTMTQGSASGNQASLRYVENGGPPNLDKTLRFDLDYTLTDLGGGSAKVRIDWKVTNLASVGQTVDFFSYTDYDLNNSYWDDSGVFTSPNRFDVVDANPQVTAMLLASTAALIGWEQGAFGALRDKLVDPNVDVLTNTSPTFGPGDWTAAFQWQFELGAAGTATAMQSGWLEKQVHNPVPEPGSMVALLVGLGAFAKRKRTKPGIVASRRP